MSEETERPTKTCPNCGHRVSYFTTMMAMGNPWKLALICNICNLGYERKTRAECIEAWDTRQTPDVEANL